MLLATETFVKFKGYASEVGDDEAVFQPDEILYIIEVDTEGEQALYTCIIADDITEYETNGDENVRGGQVAPKEVQELKGSALDKARDAYVPVKHVGRMDELLDEHDGDPIQVAIALQETIQQSYFYMGGALAMSLQAGSYLAENGGDFEGEDAFNEFCQANFGFKASKGRQLARIYSTFSGIDGFDPDRLSEVGWSIASKIEKYVTQDNVDEVLDAATEEGVTQRTVDAVMKEKFTDAEGKTARGNSASRGEKLVTRTLTFRLHEDSADSVDIAIQQYKKQHGIEDDNLALEGIIVEWAQDHVTTKTAKGSIASKARKAAKARETVGGAKAAPKKPTRKAA